jgi:hypothetical protein
MKTIKYLTGFILLLILFSCSDEWLDTKPLSIYSPESLYVDEAGFEGVLTSLRKGLRDEYVTGGYPPFKWEYITSDLAVHGIKGAKHDLDAELLPTSSGNNEVHDYWGIAYAQIRNANVIISRLDKADLPENTRSRILAEAYFHRAFWFYRLVHQYGDVPFLSKEYTSPKIDFYTHSRKTILNKIQNDMQFAVEWLPAMVDPGKVNKAAGNHLLSKICLANSDFDKAIEAAGNVIDGGNHALMTDRFGKYAGDHFYNVIWDIHQKENKSIAENKEGILMTQDKYGYPGSETPGGRTMRVWSPGWHMAGVKDPAGKRGMTDKRGEPQLVKLGRGIGVIRPANYYSYEIWTDATDLRHDTVVNWFPISKLQYNNPGSKFFGKPFDIQYTSPIDTFQSLFPWAYYKIYVEDEENPDQPNGGHTDWYVFRLAETYLLRAEAYFWKNNLAAAADDINQVRLRANASPVSQSEVSLEYILDERARELYAEEPRKTELTRIAFIMADNNLNGYSLDNFSDHNFWYDRVMDKNIFYQTNYVYNSPYKISTFHALWPIPADVIDSNQGGRINQNKGYIGSENNVAPLTEINDEQ